MNTHRFILEPYKGVKSRHTCPQCQHRDKTYAMYIDTDTGQHIAPQVGRCNRADKCGYHYPPKQYFEDNPTTKNNAIPHEFSRPLTPIQNERETGVKRGISYIPGGVFINSLKGYEANSLVQFLISLFGEQITKELISRYYIGTAKFPKGASVFWQIDINGKIRTGKIMLYNPATGKRLKEPNSYFNFVHKVLKWPDFNLQQCLFGEHLLNIYPDMPLALVESEKTALIASVYLPQFIWLATGGIQNLKPGMCDVLAGRKVILYPDLSKEGKAFKAWSEKAKMLFETFEVSTYLEDNATDAEREQGLDLADYLIRFDYREFVTPGDIKPVEPLFYSWKQLLKID